MQQDQPRASPGLPVGDSGAVGVVIQAQPHGRGMVAPSRWACTASCGVIRSPRASELPMAMIRTNAAASMLGVSTSTLRSWERRYGFPHPRRSEGGHRQYELEEIEALRHTLAETKNISSAVALAEERGAGPPSSAPLAAAYDRFDDRQPDRLPQESLSVRSLERTIDEVLLPAVGGCLDPGGTTAEDEFAWRHGAWWLAAVARLAPPAARPETGRVID